MLDLASSLRDLPARQGEPPCPGHEYVKGWGVFGLPFDSGHVLALRVTMDAPGLEWTLTASDTPILWVLNATSPRLPLWTWRSGRLVRARELLARRLLHMGDIRLSGTMPSGHFGILMPERMYFIDDSAGLLGGEDLGHAQRVRPNPLIGGVPLPARGMLAVGQAAWEILDNVEQTRTHDVAAACGRHRGEVLGPDSDIGALPAT